MTNIYGIIAGFAEIYKDSQLTPYMTYTDKEYSKKEYIYFLKKGTIYRIENTSSYDWSHPKNGVNIESTNWINFDEEGKRTNKRLVTAINIDKEQDFSKQFPGHWQAAEKAEKMKEDVISFSQKMEVEKQYAIVTDILTMTFWAQFEGWTLPRINNPASTTINTIHKGKLLFPDRKKHIDVQLVTGDYNLDKFMFPNIKITQPAIELIGQPHRIVISEDIAVMKQVGSPYLEVLIWKK